MLKWKSFSFLFFAFPVGEVKASLAVVVYTYTSLQELVIQLADSAEALQNSNSIGFSLVLGLKRSYLRPFPHILHGQGDILSLASKHCTSCEELDR
jgi:hypothetical protein